MQVLFCLISSLWSLYDSTREDISWHLLQGRYMVLGLFVFFICSLSLRRVFFHSFPSLPLSLYYSCFSSLKLFPLLFVWLCFLLYLFFSFVSFRLTASSLLPLSQCSVSCGGGVQTRSIQCLRQGRPAAGCLPHQRPVTSRACNTQFCPAAPPAPAHRSSSRVTAAGPALKGIFLRGSKEQIYSASLNDDHIITDMEEIYYWDFIQRLAAQEFARVSIILYQSNMANQLVSMPTH